MCKRGSVSEAWELRRVCHELEIRCRGADGGHGPPGVVVGSPGGASSSAAGVAMGTDSGVSDAVVRSPKFHFDVAQAQAQHRQLLAKLVEGSESDEDEDADGGEIARAREALEECTASLREISSRLRRTQLPPFCAPEAAVRAAAARAAPVAPAPASTSSPAPAAPTTTTVAPPKDILRAREGSAAGAHRDLHDDLSAEVLGMARALKQNALRFRDRLETSAGTLDAAESKVEANVASARARVKQARTFYKRNWRDTCQAYVLLFWVGVAFAFLFVLIRLT